MLHFANNDTKLHYYEKKQFGRTIDYLSQNKKELVQFNTVPIPYTNVII